MLLAILVDRIEKQRGYEPQMEQRSDEGRKRKRRTKKTHKEEEKKKKKRERRIRKREIKAKRAASLNCIQKSLLMDTEVTKDGP